MAVVDVKRRFSGLQRGLMRRLIGRSGHHVPGFLQRRIIADLALPEGELRVPDLILSSGGRSVFVARVFANRYKVPFIFIGERKPYPSEWFHTVFTPSVLEQGVNDVSIDLIPTGVTPEKVAQAAAHYECPEGTCWTMVIGGASRSHPYMETDWKQLAEGMNQLAEHHGIRWLLTTSHRTGDNAEAMLQKTLRPEVLADAIWWDTKPEKRMMAFLGAADRVFVTQDSVTMVTECVASGKSVYVLQPEKVSFPKSSFMPQYLDRLENKNRLRRILIKRFAEHQIEDHKKLAEIDIVEHPISKVLVSRLPREF
jgi:mitochondrial fission protein ELM1